MTVARCHCFSHSTPTIEEGDDITPITFFVVKPPKKAMVVVVAFFCNKAIEKGDGTKCYLFILLLKKIAVAFITTTSLEKKVIAARHYRLILLLKHPKKKATAQGWLVGRRGKFWDGSRLVVVTLFVTKIYIRRKKKAMARLCRHLLCFKQSKKMKEEE